MKRRNFLSRLLAAPLAWKARFFAPKPPMRQLTPLQLQIAKLLAEGKSMREVAAILWPRSREQWEKRVTSGNTFKGFHISLN